MILHPPFTRVPGRAAIAGYDYLSHQGATKLAERITAAWKNIGITVRAEVEQVSGVYTVRLPDLVNGRPVKRS